MSSNPPALSAAIDAERCTDCRACIPACPRDAIFEPLQVCCAKCMKYCVSIETDCKREKPAIAIDRCDGCGLCLPVCPVGAITWKVGRAPDRVRAY
jgi:Fe-S-cluster-containing hydrogenase component 2